MKPRRLIVLGCGKRVTSAVLPVVASCPRELELTGIFARTGRDIEADDQTYSVEPLSTLTRERLKEVDIIFMAVSKKAVPEVLRTLANLRPDPTDLLIETPVLLFKHLGHQKHLKVYRRVFVAEDCVSLPCFDPLEPLALHGALGEVRTAILSHSAYAYHGVATVKRLLGARKVSRATRRRTPDGKLLRTYHFSGGRRALVLEPRDYALGRMLLQGTERTLADHALPEGECLPWEAVETQGATTGFRAGDFETKLAPHELPLIGTPGEGTGLTSLMAGMKRVGLRRTFRRVALGEGYSLRAGLEDMVVDYHLEKLGRWISNPITGARGLPRFLLR